MELRTACLHCKAASYRRATFSDLIANFLKRNLNYLERSKINHYWWGSPCYHFPVNCGFHWAPQQWGVFSTVKGFCFSSCQHIHSWMGCRAYISDGSDRSWFMIIQYLIHKWEIQYNHTLQKREGGKNRWQQETSGNGSC